jgi:hypothetical protein
MGRGAGLNVLLAPLSNTSRTKEDLVDAGRDLMSLLLHLAENTGRAPGDALVLVKRLTELTYGSLFRDRFYARRHTAAEDISGVATDAARTLIGSAPDNERVGTFTRGTLEKPRLGEP